MNQVWTWLLTHIFRINLEGTQDPQRILTNMAWLIADRILRMGLGLVVGVWVARYLGPNQFGAYNYAIAFVSLFSIIATLGLDSIVIRDIILRPESKDEIVNTAFVLKFIAGIAALLVTIIAICLLRPHDTLMKWLVSITAVGIILRAFDVIDFWFQSQVASKYTVRVKYAAFLLVNLVKIVLIKTRASIFAFAWVGILELSLGALGLVIVYRQKGNVLKLFEASCLRGKKLLDDSWPLILSGLVIMVYMRVDQIMLGELVGNKEVGIYSAAVRIAENFHLIPLAIVSSTFPSIVKSREISEDLFYGRLQKLYNLMACLAYVNAVLIIFSSRFIISFLFGDDYLRSSSILSILIWSSLFVNLGVARSSFMTAMNWTRLHFRSVFLAGLINIFLNYFLIPIYGGIGAAIATLISYWFATHGSCFLYKSLRETGLMLTKSILFIWT